jgi:hypothetical protein
MPVKLVVSKTVAFEVRFALNDGGAERDFGMRMEAQREAMDTIQKEMRAGDPSTSLVGWLRDRVGLRMVAWIGDSPLVDADTDAVIAAGEVALDALPQLVSNVGALIYAGYVQAISARGKSGN